MTALHEAFFTATNDAAFVHSTYEENQPAALVEVNHTACRWTHSTREKLLQTSFLSLLTHKTPEEYSSLVEQVQRNERVCFEDELITQEGQTMPVQISLHAIDHEGKSAVLCVVCNRAEQKQCAVLEHQLLHTQKLSVIGLLAGGIAHNFNNTLMTVFGYTEMALFNLDKDSTLYKYLEQVSIACIRAKDLTGQIHAFEQQTSYKQDVVYLQKAVEESISLLREATHSNIVIEKNIDAQCGPVLADSNQFCQALMMLYTNSIQSMSSKGGTLNVTLQAVDIDFEQSKQYDKLPAGKYAHILIQDTSSGMDETARQQLFEINTSMDSPEEQSGLDLSSVQIIIRKCLGNIYVQSQPGEGTTYQIFIPICMLQSLFTPV